MTDYDIFNGDADGICALHQLRLAEPRDSVLITGVKRDIDLVRRVEVFAGDRLTVLDISLDVNREALQRVLATGAEVQFFDHHYAGECPAYANLEAHIDTAPETCTGLLVDDWLGGRYRAWAVVAAFGDNLDQVARRYAASLDLPEANVAALRELGILLNYNGYGVTLDDLFFAPDALYRSLADCVDPRDWIASAPEYNVLREGYGSDMTAARALTDELGEPQVALYRLPDIAWARRVSGVLANDLSNDAPDRAHALLSLLPDGNYRVSVRAPISRRTGADALCRQFPTGGGRPAAAGINTLPADRVETFVARLREAFAS